MESGVGFIRFKLNQLCFRQSWGERRKPELSCMVGLHPQAGLSKYRLQAVAKKLPGITFWFKMRKQAEENFSSPVILTVKKAIMGKVRLIRLYRTVNG